MGFKTLFGAVALTGLLAAVVPAAAQMDPMADPAAADMSAMPAKPMMHSGRMMHHKKMMMHHRMKMMHHKKMMNRHMMKKHMM